VWWDRELLPGEHYVEVIEEVLDAAKCVVMLWSKASVVSKWVKVEADQGADRDIFVPVLLEEAKIPLRFRSMQTARLVDWPGTSPHPELHSLLMAAARKLTQPI
jgi:hypothetical protein